MSEDLLKAYAREIRRQRRGNPEIGEPALAPAFQALIADLLPTLAQVPALIVSPEFRRAGIGRPDIALVRQGQPPRAFIELKAPEKGLDAERWPAGHDRRQFERFGELAHWALSNFHEFRLFRRGTQTGRATILPGATLDLDMSDGAADRIIESHDPEPFLSCWRNWRVRRRRLRAMPPTWPDCWRIRRGRCVRPLPSG